MNNIEKATPTLRHHLEGMKKEIRGFPNGYNSKEEEGYNRAISDLISALPQLAEEILKEVGEDVPSKFQNSTGNLNKINLSGKDIVMNQERSRIRTLLTTYFK